MQPITAIYLLDARLFFRSWVGRAQVALIEGPNTIAVNIDTHRGGPRRSLGFALATRRLECHGREPPLLAPPNR
jgi:hypothetical protein